jgi:hypothetical protein
MKRRKLKQIRLEESTYKQCERLFTTDGGQPWRLNMMPFFVEIYDKPRNKLLLITSRQSTKTTYLRNVGVQRSLRNPGNAAIYIAPTNSQVGDFSRKKLDNVFAYNTGLKKMFVDRGCTWNVLLKEFRVGKSISRITLRSTGGAQGAGRVRGNTANDILADEYQDLLEEDMPVVEECAATFDGMDGRPEAFYVYTGTPLSSQNHINKQFQASRRYEWIMQCPHCSSGLGINRSKKDDFFEREARKGGWNHPIGMQHVDTRRPYLFCEHCGKDMNCPSGFPPGTRIPPFGVWEAQNPNGRFDGYRVVRMMMPWARWRTENADGILDRLELYPERRFHNEVMGLSFDAGMLPILEADVMALAKDHSLPTSDEEMARVAEQYRGHLTFAGLDWAMQALGDDANSYTIIGVFALVNDKLRLIYAHRFQGLGSNDPDYVYAFICRIIELFNVKRIGADYGVGYKEDLRLIKRYGQERVACFQYKQTAARAKSVFDVNSRVWSIPRTRTIDQLCVDIKNKNFELPRYEQAKVYTNDWLNLVMDVNPMTRVVRYEHIGPDDFAHVANYANLAKRLEFREGEFAGANDDGQAPLGDSDLYDDGYFEAPGMNYTYQ